MGRRNIIFKIKFVDERSFCVASHDIVLFEGCLTKKGLFANRLFEGVFSRRDMLISF